MSRCLCGACQARDREERERWVKAELAREREACAALVEAAGCICLLLLNSCCFSGSLVPLEPLLDGPPEELAEWDGRAPYDENGDPVVETHDSRCPTAISGAIRRRA